MRLVGQSTECLVWNTVFSFYCAIGKAIWKIACSNSRTGGEEILKAYLVQTKITAFKKMQPNVLTKCARAYTQVNTQSYIYKGLRIVAA